MYAEFRMLDRVWTMEFEAVDQVRWLHIAFTWHVDSGPSLFIDGYRQYAETTLLAFPSYDLIQTFYIGRPNDVTDSESYNKFVMDELYIVERQYSDEEIRGLYEQGKLAMF